MSPNKRDTVSSLRSIWVGHRPDVALCPGVIPETSESVVAGCPVSVPTVAIHTVGAGAAPLSIWTRAMPSRLFLIARAANPGPACYGKGDRLAVTDANVLLGRIDPAYFLGAAHFPSIQNVHRFSWRNLPRTYAGKCSGGRSGIIRVINASMERARRTVSLEQGYDPRLFTLFPSVVLYLPHACELAEALRIPSVFVPRYPGVLSALGHDPGTNHQRLCANGHAVCSHNG